MWTVSRPKQQQPKPRPRRVARAIRSLRHWTRSIFGKCHYCGARVLAYCDHVDEAGDLCCTPICLAHAKAHAGKFYCPQHQPQP
jgi:hypothetical protein